MSFVRVAMQVFGIKSDLTTEDAIRTDDDGRALVAASELPDLTGTWGYAGGTSGTVALSGNKRVLQITAISLTAAGTIQINGGDAVPVPVVSSTGSALCIEPVGQLIDPTIIFTNTDSYFIEHLT
jgi:hypothetical protein